MTIQTEVSVQSQVFIPRDYDVFAGLDVDHHSIAATFTDHGRLMRSLVRMNAEFRKHTAVSSFYVTAPGQA